MNSPVKDDLESIMAEMQGVARQERELYGQPAGEQPPPEYYGPPDDYYPAPDDMTAPSKPKRREAPPQQPAEDLPDIDRMNISLCLETEPPRRDFIVSSYIPAGAVGLLIGTGATGKSYLELLMCMGIACGRSIPPFDVEEARVVIIVSAEDDLQDIHFRMRRIAEEYPFSEEQKDLLDKNLIIFPARGKLGPLMGLESQNPVRALAAEWLEKQIRLHQPGLVILDTKSRLYGLDENSNDHGAQWVSLLESMIVDQPGTSIMIISHTSKASAAAGEHHATRGASSVGDNCRFGLALTWLSDDEAKAMGIRDPGGLIKLSHTKASYSKQLDPVIFSKNAFGVPVLVDIDTNRNLALGLALDLLIEVLLRDHQGEFNKRLLEKASEAIPKAIKAEIVDLAGIAKTDWPKVIALGIESARLEAFEDASSPARNKSVLIRVRQSETQDFADEGMTQNQLFQTVQTGMDGKTGTSNCPNWL